MDPSTSALLDGGTNEIHPQPSIVVSANRHDRREVAELADQCGQLAQLGPLVRQVAAEQHRIRTGGARSVQYLGAEPIGAIGPQVDVTRIEQPARICPGRQPFFADVERLTEAEFQRPSGEGRSDAGGWVQLHRSGSIPPPPPRCLQPKVSSL
jgi:hypothetical protein